MKIIQEIETRQCLEWVCLQGAQRLATKFDINLDLVYIWLHTYTLQMEQHNPSLFYNGYISKKEI